MPSKDRAATLDCQLQVANDATDSLTFRDRVRHLMLKLMSTIERRTQCVRVALGQTGYEPPQASLHLEERNGQQTHQPRQPAPGNGFQPGEMVEVLSWDEIQATLDEQSAWAGLQFMEGMKKFCGRRMVVRKRLRTIFDERAWRMLKIRNTYILHGAICDGRHQYEQEGCDRCCFFFWKDRWLRKLP